MAHGFHPGNQQYFPPDYFQQLQEDDYLRHRAQSTSSNTSSDSINQIRLMQQRLPPTSARTNYPQNKNTSPENSQLPSGNFLLEQKVYFQFFFRTKRSNNTK